MYSFLSVNSRKFNLLIVLIEPYAIHRKPMDWTFWLYILFCSPGNEDPKDVKHFKLWIDLQDRKLIHSVKLEKEPYWINFSFYNKSSHLLFWCELKSRCTIVGFIGLNITASRTKSLLYGGGVKRSPSRTSNFAQNDL